MVLNEWEDEMHTGSDGGWDPNTYPIKEVDPERCIEKLKGIGEILSYPKGATIVESGAHIDSCFIVLEGLATAHVLAESGAEHLYIGHNAGYAVLEAQCFCEWSETAYFQAEEPTKILVLKRAELLAAMERDFELALFFIGTLSIKFRWYVEHCRNLSAHGAMHRFCDLLIDMATRYGTPGEGGLRLNKKISQEELAMKMHVNRLTVIRCMKELRDNGLADTKDGYIFIRDMDELKSFSKTCDR